MRSSRRRRSARGNRSLTGKGVAVVVAVSLAYANGGGKAVPKFRRHARQTLEIFGPMIAASASPILIDGTHLPRRKAQTKERRRVSGIGIEREGLWLLDGNGVIL